MNKLATYFPWAIMIVLIVLILLILKGKAFGLGRGGGGDSLVGGGGDINDPNANPVLGTGGYNGTSNVNVNCSKVYRNGDSGTEVGIIQSWINNQLATGNYPFSPVANGITEDGIFGFETEQGLFSTFGKGRASLAELGIPMC